MITGPCSVGLLSKGSSREAGAILVASFKTPSARLSLLRACLAGSSLQLRLLWRSPIKQSGGWAILSTFSVKKGGARAILGKLQIMAHPNAAADPEKILGGGLNNTYLRLLLDLKSQPHLHYRTLPKNSWGLQRGSTAPIWVGGARAPSAPPLDPPLPLAN